MASTELRAAAQQALEACKLIVSAFDALKPASAARNEPLQINAARASITALEAALAEPVQEPVAYSVGRTLHWHEGKGVNDAQMYLAPPQRKPLTEEEEIERIRAAERERLIRAVESVPPHRWVDGSDQWGNPCPAKVVATKSDYVAAMRAADKRNVPTLAEPVQDHFRDARKMVQEPAQETEMRRCPRCWEPMFPPHPTPLTVARLRDALVAARIVPPAAVEDPDGYDDGVTLHRIEALHRRLA